MDCFDYECYEPSEEEIFLDELKDKFRDILRGDVKSEIEKLKKENAELRKTVKEYKDKKSELESKEKDLKYKAENIQREVEKDFYNKTVVEVLENMMEDSEVWYAENVPHEQVKCNLCNDERELVAIYPNGEVTTKHCDCSRPIYWYEPAISTIKTVKFNKAYKPRYSSEKKMYFQKKHCPDTRFSEAYDHYSEFRIELLFDEFNDEAKDYHETKNYGIKVGFRTKDACQKYCDWLNKKSKK